MAIQETTKRFFNWTGHDFTCTWNKEPYVIKAGMSLLLPSGIADTFAYHLAIDEMNRTDTDHGRWDIRDVWVAKALTGTESVAMSPERMKIELMNQTMESTPIESVNVADVPETETTLEVPKKRGRPAKAKEEPKFEGVE